jgi:dTDP-4-amino-4,6-dideoxygalactose transaminase
MCSNSSVGKQLRLGPRSVSYAITMINKFHKRKSVFTIAQKQASEKIMERFPLVQLPSFSKNVDCSWHRLPVLTNTSSQRSSLLKWLRKNNIEGSCSWPPEIVRANVALAGESPKDFPNSFKASKTMINVPVWVDDIWRF